MYPRQEHPPHEENRRKTSHALQLSEVQMRGLPTEEGVNVAWQTCLFWSSEQKANMLAQPAMHRRPEPTKNDAMSEGDLEKFQRGLAHLAPQTVLSDFRALLAKALGLDLPSPRLMQEVLVHWKLLWKWRR